MKRKFVLDQKKTAHNCGVYDEERGTGESDTNGQEGERNIESPS